MFLEFWMLGILVLLFGFAGYFSSKSGYISGLQTGSSDTLKILEKNNVIILDGDTIVPYPTLTIDVSKLNDEEFARVKEKLEDYIKNSTITLQK